MNGLISPQSDNYLNNPQNSERLFQFWDSTTFSTTTSAATYTFFDSQGNTNTTKLPSANRFAAGWDVTVWRMHLEPIVTGQTPATALDLNALISGSWIRIMRNSTETVAEYTASTIAAMPGGVYDPGNLASNAQVATYSMPASSSPITLPNFGQWSIPSGQFFHVDWIVDSAITISASTTLKICLWTELIKPTS